jgi:ComEC/Rec2-related protein
MANRGWDPLVGMAAGMVTGVLTAPWLEPCVPLGALAVGGFVVALLVGGSELFAGVALGWLVVASMPEGPTLRGPVAVEAVVIGGPVGTQADVAVTRWANPGGPWNASFGRVRVRFPMSDLGPVSPPPPGTAVVAFGVAGPIDSHALPGDPDPVSNALRSRVRTELRAERWAPLGGVVPRRDPFEGARHGAVLRALATGDRRGLDEETWTIMRRTGTAHVLSISGFHVGIVSLVLGGGLRAFLRLAALVRPVGVSLAPAWILGAAGGAAYAWASGAPASAQRAAWMVGLAAIAHASGREVRPLNLLGAAAIAVVVVDPASIGTAGFQLSFGAMLGLLRVTPWLLRFLPPDVPWLLDWFARALATTAGATVGTCPASFWWFQELAPLSPLANLIALPWVSFAVVPFAALGALLPDPFSGFAVGVGDGAMEGLVRVLRPLAVAPWTFALGPVGALACAMSLVLPRPSIRALSTGVLLASIYEPIRDESAVTFLDVGQGDCALVEQPDGRRWLIDAGPPPGDAVVRYLRRRGIRHLDVVVASHGHPDHTGGLAPVLDGIDVDELWLPGTEGLDALLRLAAARGVRVRLRPPASLHPDVHFRGEGLNDRSLVLPLAGALFPGDVEAEGEAALLPRVHPIQLLKVPHHGSRTSSSPTLLDALLPEIAVVQAGRNNRFKHPHAEVLERYVERGIALYRTDRDGTIEVTLGADPLVRTWRPGAGWSERAPPQAEPAPFPVSAIVAVRRLARTRATTMNTTGAATASTNDSP